MEWWANIVATLSLLLAVSAFIWAIKTFGRAKPRLEIELSVIEPTSLTDALGAAGPVVMELIRAAAPDAPEAIEKFRTDAIPYLRKALPEWVAGSPLLSRVLPSLATMLADSRSLEVTIRNQGVNDISVVAIEVGSGKRWGEVEGRAIFGRMTDVLPVSVRAGADLDIWFPIEKVEACLSALGLHRRASLVRVRTIPKASFTAQLGTVNFAAKEVAA